MFSEIRWGIVGPGTIAREFADDLQYLKDKRHYVNAIVGHRKESVESFLSHTPVSHVFYNVADLINSGTIDCAYISTPHPLHYEACLAFLDAGIPVLCEKPLAMNAEEVSEIIAKSRSTNTFFMEGMWTRFLPSIVKVLDIIKAGIIGDVNSIGGRLTYKAPFDLTSRYFNPDLGGGSLLDLGIYPVFLAYQILGKPVDIKAVGKMTSSGVDGGCVAVMEHTGAYSLIESSLVKRAPNDVTIFGDKGAVIISEPFNEKPEKITLQIYNGEKTEILPQWEGKGLHFEITEMINCLESGKTESQLWSHTNSLELIQILDQIRLQIELKYPKEKKYNGAENTYV